LKTQFKARWRCFQLQEISHLDGALTNKRKIKTCLILDSHFAHIKNISNEQMDQLLSIIVDAEVLYTTLGLQKDKFIKKIYSFLFTFLHQCVAERKPAIIQGPLGDPEKSFEKPSIQKIIKNFVILKYDKLRENNEAEFKVIMEVARTFLNCYNNWDFPNDCKDANAEENFYKIEYVQRSTSENLLMLIEFVFLFSATLVGSCSATCRHSATASSTTTAARSLANDSCCTRFPFSHSNFCRIMRLVRYLKNLI
jgi:hypothetical protein